MKLVTAAQMRELEQQAVAAGTSLDELMEQAGLAVAQETWLLLGVVAGRRILVLVGPGNNGGDGLVAARHLAEWEGDVAVYLTATRPVDDPRVAAAADAGASILGVARDGEFAGLDRALEGAEVIVDAILGTGRSRPIHDALAPIMERVAAAMERPLPPKVVAVDLPTGVDADSGKADPLALRADLTVTFGVPKVGLYSLPGSEYAGRVQVVDIGLPKEAERSLPLELLSAQWVRERLPARPSASNKGTFGRVLVVAGSKWYVGAARLAAEACYRVGAGLVTIASPRSVQAMLAPAISEATWLPLDEDDGAIAASSARAVCEALADYDVLLLGPGLSQRDSVRSAVDDIVGAIPSRVRACVVDADALNCLSRHDKWWTRLTPSAQTLVTPHPGEMARLVGSTVSQVQEDRLGAAISAAAAWGVTVVLKGAHTVIAAPGGRGAISPHANPLLASAGTGDVLAGAIAGLLTQGADVFDAAGCGVFLHSKAAEELSEELGQRGLLAGDLLPALPRTIRGILQGRPARSTGLADFGALGISGGGMEVFGGPGAVNPPT